MRQPRAHVRRFFGHDDAAAGVQAVVIRAEFFKRGPAAALAQRDDASDGDKTKHAEREPFGVRRAGKFHGQHEDAPDEKPQRHLLHDDPQQQQPVQPLGE